MALAAGSTYRAGRYKSRSAGSRLVLYGLVLAVTLWLVGPFVWLFVTSISYQKNLLARPLSFIPPEITLDNYKMILGLIRFHAEGQAAKIIPSITDDLPEPVAPSRTKRSTPSNSIEVRSR